MPSKKYRSEFEAKIAAENPGLAFEPIKLSYTVPAKSHKYKPDFQLENGIIVETKGYLRPSDRKLLVLVRDQNPDLDIRIVFQRSANKLSAKSKTTYSTWATKNGFTWADGSIPESWRKEVRADECRPQADETSGD